MKYALISDIHGNLEALTAVMDDIQSHHVDSVHCLGDTVGYSSDPSACLDIINQRCDTRLLGNHDYAALGLQSADVFNDAARAAAEWTQTQLSDHDMEAMANFDIDRTLDGMYLVHASPFEPDQWHYIFTIEEARLAFQHLKNKIGFYGHSHVPMILREAADGTPRSSAGHSFLPDRENRYLVNVGSVGQPRDNDPRACYVVFDDEDYEVIFNRVAYDIAAAQEKMTRANLPEALISRLSVGL